MRIDRRKLLLGTVATSVVTTMVLIAWLLQFVVPHPFGGGHPAVQPVRTVASLLQREYIKTVDNRQLLNGGVSGLRELLESHELDATLLPDIPEEDDEDSRTLYFAFEQRLEDATNLAGDKASSEEITYAALKGMADSLDDPYCMVLDPQEYGHFEEMMKGGNFGGIGIYIEVDRENEERLTVVEPIEGTPAHRAGLKPKDVILEIDGVSTEGITVEEAAQRIRGPEGSKVVLTILRGEKDPFEVAVERAVIHVRSVEAKMLEGDVGYVKLRIFGDATASEFLEELESLEKQGARALILDLRNNGGGYVQAALSVASHFVPRDERVVSVVNPRTGRDDVHYSEGGKNLGLPTVVLVNRFSASASEITAGALQDHHLAHLIGEKTFGKASVQQLYELSDGGAVKYTVAHYLTPSGRDIHKSGIEVDVEIPMDEHYGENGEDAALDKALAFLKKEQARR